MFHDVLHDYKLYNKKTKGPTLIVHSHRKTKKDFFDN